MPDRRLEDVLKELRLHSQGTGPEAAATARAIHELEVYHEELLAQNQELRDTQEALSHARDRFRTLFEEAPVPFLSLDEHGLVREANRAALELLDREASRLVGKPLAVSLAEREPRELFRHLAAVTATKAPQKIELELRHGPGGPKHVVLQTSLLPGGENKFLCLLTDVTAQREVERNKARLENRLREAEKLEAIGRVAANIAHDVNNTLVSVISLGEFMRASMNEDPAAAADLDGLLDAAWRGARLMRGLLGLSRPGGRNFRSVDLSGLVRRVAEMVRHQKEGQVTMHLSVPAESIWVMADEDELLQAILNVAKNGVEAMARGTLTLECERAPGTPPAARVRITDQGVGMDEETLAKAFEPLFTTKAETGGSGLGLTLVHRTLRAHGGTIELSSTPGQGTVAVLELPLAQGLEGGGLAPGAALPNLHGLTVLLVDDDERVRRTTRRQLEALGGKVVDFDDGEAALGAVRSGLLFDVGLIDVNMPGWSGPQLVEQLFTTLGRVPVVFVTGASGELIPRAMLDVPYVRLVQKPWSRRELVDAVHHVRRAASERAEPE